MIAELREVILKVEQLKEDEQKRIAKLLDDEIQWENTLQNSQNQLSNLAKEAIQEYKARNTKQEDW